jgi:hypothetical protein
MKLNPSKSVSAGRSIPGRGDCSGIGGAGTWSLIIVVRVASLGGFVAAAGIGLSPEFKIRSTALSYPFF